MARPAMSLYDYCMIHPECINLLSEFDEERNGITVHEASARTSKTYYWWYCPIHDYHWKENSYNRTQHPTPPCCSGKVATQNTNLTAQYPNIMLDWDYTKNTVDPSTILPGSHKEAYWKCHICGHEWVARIDSRAITGNGCPECSQANSSKAEHILKDYLKMSFPDVTTQKYNKSTGTIELDIIIPSLRIAIEYDGYPWHLDKLNSHIEKLNYCNSNGYILINIAEYKGLADSSEITQEVLNQYTPNHNVLYINVNGAYTPVNVIDYVYEYFTKNGVKNLVKPTQSLKRKLSDNTVRTKELEISLWTHSDYQWLHHWITDPESIKRAKACTPRSGSTTITLTCPDCGRKMDITPHHIGIKFLGCGIRAKGYMVDDNGNKIESYGCGCKKYITQEHLDKIKDVYTRAREAQRAKRNNPQNNTSQGDYNEI